MPKTKRGYRKFFTRPPKGCKPYKAKEPWPSSAHPRVPSWAGEHFETDCSSSTQQGTSASYDDGEFLGWDVDPLPEQPVSGIQNSMRVLSLFDGISCGFVALQRLGLNIETYFSSEIDIDAISVQRFHFFNELTPLGSVTSLNECELNSLGDIHLLLGGSPCNDLSIVNPRRRGLHGLGSSGRLFYDFVRIRNYLLHRAKERGFTLFWLFENTTALEKETLAQMSSALTCQPVKRCASEFVGMRRQRLFWGNIPLMEMVKTADRTLQPHLQMTLKPYRRANVEWLPTITTSIHSQRSGKLQCLPVIEGGKETLLYISELELLFGLPEHFTDVGNMSISKRRRLLGRAWCVPVIIDLLRPLLAIFKKDVQY